MYGRITLDSTPISSVYRTIFYSHYYHYGRITLDSTPISSVYRTTPFSPLHA